MREIIIDTDTTIGFNYEKHYFYITNKNTTTTRTTAQNAKNVLDVVAPDNTISVDDLISLSTTMEELTELYYTWEDTGAYIKTIQLNDYEDHPLTLDTEKKKLYVMNSPLIFDLTLNEGRRERLIQLQAFYRDTLGLDIALTDLQILYTLILSFYNPTCYNVIQSVTTGEEEYTLTYSNVLKLSDYRNISPATYTCTLNPNSLYSFSKIADIQAIDTNIITLTSEVPADLKVGSTINLSNTATTIDIATYTSDGSYEVQAIEGNLIFTTENLPASFSVTLPTLNIVAYQTPIVKIDRDEQSITLTKIATDFLIGDRVVIKGTEIPTEYETLTVDGFYTIVGIKDNVLYVEEVPPTNYTPSAPYTAYVYKPIPILTVTGINNNIITVSGEFPSTLEVNTPVVETLQEGTDTYLQYGKVTGLDQSNNTVVIDTAWENNVQQYGQLRKPLPRTDTLTEVTSTSKATILPIGSFMVDNPQQSINYLSLLNSLVLPSNDEISEEGNNIGNYNNCYLEVRNYYIIPIVNNSIDRMVLKGLYSKVYK